MLLSDGWSPSLTYLKNGLRLNVSWDHLFLDLEINSRQKAMKTAYSTYQLRYSLSTEAACHDLLVTENMTRRMLWKVEIDGLWLLKF